MRKKLLAMALSVCMILTMLPTTAFAVSEKSDLGTNANTTTAAEIAFGTDGSGNARLWRVIGYDGTGAVSEAGTITLLAKNYFGSTNFAVPNKNNYGTNNSTSTPQSNLKTAIENSVTFTTAEIGVIAPVTLTGGATATAQDGMYGDDVTGAKLWPLSVTEAKAVNVDLRKISSSWWLRSPGRGPSAVALVNSFGTVDSDGHEWYTSSGVRPALKLNLGSVLFASAASGGKSSAVGGADNFSEITDTALKLRFEDNSVLSASNASVSASGNIITYTAPADSVLVVETTSSGKTYQARKNMDTAASNTTLNLKTIAGLTDGAAVTGKVWIEKMEDTANNKGLIYAIAPTDVSYTAGLSDAEKVAAAKTAIETALGSLTVSNATTESDILTAATGATLYGVTVAWDGTSGFGKTNATSSATGSITGTLNLTLGSENGTVTVNKTIAQLPLSDAEKVAAAKAAIETALSNLAVSNTTTAQDVLDAAQGATLHGVSVAWDVTSGFSKSNATSSAAGSITGTLNLTLSGATNTISVNKAIAKLSSGNSGSSSGGGGSSSNTTATSSTTVQVNGESHSAGTTANTTNSTGQTVTTVTVDTAKLDKVLETKGDKATVTIPVTANSDVAIAGLTGQMVKNMESKEATLEVKTGTAAYTLPAKEINIDEVSQQLGQDVKLSDIKVQIKIAEPPASSIKVVENSAKAGDFTIVVPPVNFDISCTYNGKSVDVSKFNSYVERTVAIPDGVDPTKITTGVVVEPDGTVRHVPTQIIKMNGKYVAKINSLTNSTYTLIWSPITFADIENHWAKDSINNMGSRKVVSGVGNGNYSPDSAITRAEFAAIVVRALGLETGTGKNQFSDVKMSDWFCGYVETASKYGVINGKSATTFAPNDQITREQAMAMIARAMKITGLEPTLTESEISELLASYTDAASSSIYAESGIASCLKTGVISGTSSSTLAPKNTITRAEVAVIVERFLKKSELI